MVNRMIRKTIMSILHLSIRRSKAGEKRNSIKKIVFLRERFLGVIIKEMLAKYTTISEIAIYIVLLPPK